MTFYIKKTFFYMMKRIREISSSSIQAIMNDAMLRNGFFAHSKNIFVEMLSDDNKNLMMLCNDVMQRNATKSNDVMQGNGFFAHSKNIFVEMLSDDNKNLRRIAVNKILKVRESIQGKSLLETEI